MKQFYYNQEVLFRTYLPQGGWAKGREYVWMKDGDGTIYLLPVDENGTPKFV